MEISDACDLCCETYTETLRPRVLHCGHSFCTDCITKLISRHACPQCNKLFFASDASEVSVNYSLERCISRPQSTNKMLKMHDTIESQKSIAKEIISSSDDMVMQLSDYQEFLKNSMEKHKSLVEKLRRKLDCHETMIKQIMEEQEKTKTAQKQITRYNLSISARIPEINCAENFKAITNAMVKVLEDSEDVTETLNKCRAEFPDSKIILSHKELVRSAKLVEDIGTGLDEQRLCAFDFSKKCMTILEKIDLYLNDIRSLSVNQLKSQQNFWKVAIEDGKVFATTNNKLAVLSFKHGVTYLHCLQDLEPPPSSFKIKHKDILSCTGEEHTVAFLDFGWDNSYKGRIHIQMPSHTPLAQHFKSVCTGEFGATYINKKVYKLSFSPKSISIESYAGKNGVVDCLSETEFIDIAYRCSPEKGMVWMKRDGTIHILTNPSYGAISFHSFGKVRRGIDVLKDAEQRKRSGFNDVKVIDSGVVVQT